MQCTREPIYKVGDVVQIVDKPYLKCPCTWVRTMDKYCGRIATITEVVLELPWGTAKEEAYRIDVDSRKHAWCANCFIFEPDLEESVIDPSVLFQ